MPIKTYRLTFQDQEKLAILASHCQAIRTHRDEDKGLLYVFTTSANNPQPTTPVLRFQMESVVGGDQGTDADPENRS